MALALDHFRSIPQDLYPLEQRFSDSVPALVGCITTAARYAVELDEGEIFDLVARAFDRVDEVVQITSRLCDGPPDSRQHAAADSLATIKLVLGVLVEAWGGVSMQERHNLLEMARLSLARFCLLSRDQKEISSC